MRNKVLPSSNDFSKLTSYIEENSGIFIKQEKYYLIKTRLAAMLGELECDNTDELLQKALADKTYRIRDKIINAMTTNETLWFRDQIPFKILENALLPYFIGKIRNGELSKINIWSAACSTGQEPYSIAITFLEYISSKPFINSNHIDILATDISSMVLEKAISGRYDELSISRGLSNAIRSKYFVQDGKYWQVHDSVKKMIRFRQFNLQDPYISIGVQNIIFCRNVLIYFTNVSVKTIIEKMTKLLKPDGYMFLGATESILNHSRAFDIINYNPGLCYQIKPD